MNTVLDSLRGTGRTKYLVKKAVKLGKSGEDVVIVAKNLQSCKQIQRRIIKRSNFCPDSDSHHREKILTSEKEDSGEIMLTTKNSNFVDLQRGFDEVAPIFSDHHVLIDHEVVEDLVRPFLEQWAEQTLGALCEDL